MIIFLYLVSFAAQASALPELTVPKDWRKCAVAADCVVAGDGCRSCGKLIILNKKFSKEFLALDDGARRKANFMPTCEACSSAHVVLSCRNSFCEYEQP